MESELFLLPLVEVRTGDPQLCQTSDSGSGRPISLAPLILSVPPDGGAQLPQEPTHCVSNQAQERTQPVTSRSQPCDPSYAGVVSKSPRSCSSNRTGAVRYLAGLQNDLALCSPNWKNQQVSGQGAGPISDEQRDSSRGRVSGEDAGSGHWSPGILGLP